MVENPERPQEAGLSQSWTSFHEAATALVTPKLYDHNPFRLLGLSVVAGARDVAKRFDQLRMAEELGTDERRWAFAPAGAGAVDAWRGAVQATTDPKQRLLAEFFWFWPEAFPAEKADAATDALAAGHVAEAVNHWASKSADEAPVALHNLAVYHHLMALAQETAQPPVADDDRTAWWSASIRYWDTLLANEACWSLFKQRVAERADPQVGVDLVPRFRKSLRDLLAGVHSAFALRYAEAGDTSAAARHVAHLGEIYSDPNLARRALERGASPVVRRVDARVADSKRSAAAAPHAALEAARNLILHCLQDIHVVDTLCGRESELGVETNTLLGGAALDLVVAYQRASGRDADCLPLLVYLRTLPLAPEARRRVEATHEVIFGNAAAPAAAEGEGDELADPGYARKYRVLREQLLPGLAALDLGEKALFDSAALVAEALSSVAQEACDERDDIDFALHVLDTRAALPGLESQCARREWERTEFQRHFQEQKANELRLELGESLIEVTRRGIVWNGHVTPVQAVTGLRHGRVALETVPTPGADLVVAWCTEDVEVVLDGQIYAADPENAEANYLKILEALYFFAVPPLIERLAGAVRKGEKVIVGAVEFDAAGAKLPTGSRLWKREQQVAYSDLRHAMEDGCWVVHSAGNPRFQERYSTADTWNAVIAGYVIDALALR